MHPTVSEQQFGDDAYVACMTGQRACDACLRLAALLVLAVPASVGAAEDSAEQRPRDAAEAVREGDVSQWLKYYQREREVQTLRSSRRAVRSRLQTQGQGRCGEALSGRRCDAERLPAPQTSPCAGEPSAPFDRRGNGSPGCDGNVRAHRGNGELLRGRAPDGHDAAHGEQAAHGAGEAGGRATAPAQHPQAEPDRVGTEPTTIAASASSTRCARPKARSARCRPRWSADCT